MMVSLIAAVADNGAIGLEGGLPWRLPEDMAWFKRTTMGKPLIMGRATQQALGKPLRGRHNILLTRNPAAAPAGFSVATSWDESLRLCAGATEAMVIGGAQIYALALESGRADRLYLTRVHAAPRADTFFPPVDWAQWRLVSRDARPTDANHACAFTFEIWERAKE